jgi:hypothetical protein
MFVLLDDRRERCHRVPDSRTTRARRAAFRGPRDSAAAAAAAATGRGPSPAANRKGRSEGRTEVEEKGNYFIRKTMSDILIS